MHQRSQLPRYVTAFLLFAIAIFAITWVATRYLDSKAPMESGTSDGMLAYERNSIEVFQRASPAVLFVHNLQSQRNFWTRDVTEVQKGTGSGFLWNQQGHIVTNFHVVQGATRVVVTLIDGNSYPAEIVGVEPRKDLAVLKIELLETNVQPFEGKVADSARILVGQKALAIGNPFGLDHTLTVGSISAVDRSMRSIVEGVTIRDMIQTDAPINPGNSGGPLLDSSGNLLGMNTLILRNSTGIGFAVPSNTIARIVKQIIKHGRPIQSGIGVTIFGDRFSVGVARRLGVEGVLVREVTPGSPADQVGLRGTSQDALGNLVLGDIIVEIDGEPISNYDDMYNAFDEKAPGDDIEIVYYRDGERHRISTNVITVSE